MNRFDFNPDPKKIKDKRRKAVYQRATAAVAAGQLCDDCKELHNSHKAMGFIIQEAVPGSEFDFFVSYLCQLHLDMFVMKQDSYGLFIGGKKLAN